MEQRVVRIVAHEKICTEYYRLTFEWENAHQIFFPGQFIELRIHSHIFDPLIRRPFSVFAVSPDTLSIAYRVIGKGTLLLSQKCVGDSIDVIGPLGNGYPLTEAVQHKKIVLIAGGTGIASLAYALHHIALHCARDQRDVSCALYAGFRSSHDAFCVDELRQFCTVHVATQDGSMGTRGVVTDLFSREDIADALVFSCGPMPMLKAVAEYTRGVARDVYVSLEEYMGCGTGICNGCVVHVQNEFKRVCKDGPVFNAKDILWAGCA